VAEIAYWLVKSYDPNAALTLDINSEPDRIVFVKTVALILVGLLIYTVQAYHTITIKASKANLRLNTKRLYMADRNAVQELLKIADLLYKAHNMLANVCVFLVHH
jgi:clusterin-associated protein 1